LDVIVVFHVCWLGPSLPIASRRARTFGHRPRHPEPCLSLYSAYVLASTPVFSHKRQFMFFSPTLNSILTNFDPVFKSLLRIAHTNLLLLQTLIYILRLFIVRPSRAFNLSASTTHATCYFDNPTLTWSRLIWSYLLQLHNNGWTQRPMGSFRGGSP
jgi:hypothetical protein